MVSTRGRISLRDQMLKNQSSMDLYAALADKPRVLINVPSPPKKRAAPSQPSIVPLEHDVQKQIIDGLRMHPMVGLVERVNSGSAVETDDYGVKRHIAFHRVYRVDDRRMRSVDVHCTLRPSGKRFVIEVKRPGWRGPKTDREIEQGSYIARVIECGGAGMFATSWDQVAAELQRIGDL